MAEGEKVSGAPLLERTFDITKWFRQLGVATLDRWKCLGYVEGGFCVDSRIQIDCRSSAHSAQRTTFLLTALIQRAATGERWGLRTKKNHPSQEKTSEQAALTAWLRNRQRIHETRSTTALSREEHTIPYESLVHFSSF